MKALKYDVNFFFNWLASKHYLSSFFLICYKKFGKGSFYGTIIARTKLSNPIDYVESIFGEKITNGELLIIEKEWKEYISEFLSYSPKHNDIIYAGFWDVDGLHSWIAILDDIKEDGYVKEVASIYNEAPIDFEDEIGNLSYGIETDSYMFMRKATNEEKVFLLKYLESDGLIDTRNF